MPDLITADHATRAWREDGIEPGARWHDIPGARFRLDRGAAKADVVMIEISYG